MTEILTLDGINNPKQQPPEVKAKQLPKPSTYHLLCMVPKAEESYDSGIIKSAKSMHHEELLSPVLFVVSLGPDAYKDKDRFPNGPSCKAGDFIITRPNTGTRVKIHDQEFRIINDDAVEATVEDPRGIARA